MIDLGQLDNSSLKQAKWEPLIVQNNEFIHNKPVGSAQVSNNELIIFGGQGNFTYTLDITHHTTGSGNQTQQPARLTRRTESNLLTDTRFC